MQEKGDLGITLKIQTIDAKGNKWFLVGLPVQFSRDVNVIHETLNVERQVRGVGTHQFFQFLTLLVKPDQSPGLWLDIQLVLLAKFLAEMLHQYLVEVLSSQLWVTSRGKDLRDVEKRSWESWRNEAEPLIDC